jgi:S-adenosylmethionine decarboxylase
MKHPMTTQERTESHGSTSASTNMTTDEQEKLDLPPATNHDFQFVGRHLVVSYKGCSRAALTDLTGLKGAMRAAVTAAGATLLAEASHVFPPDGLTLVLLLSESHASIHTYPEHAACFLDIFTCGLRCRSEKFDAVLSAYLRPSSADRKLFVRGRDNEEMPVFA